MKRERIGPKIKQLSKSKSLTQKELADALGYSDKSMITHIEKGDSDMTYEKILLLLKTYCLDANELFAVKEIDEKIAEYKKEQGITNKGLIITNQEIRHNEYKIQRFQEEFSKLGIDLEVRKNDGTLAKIVDNSVVLNIPKCDFIIYLDKDQYLARLLEKSGQRLFNRADFIKLCDDKMLTFIKCANEGIKMPDTYAGPLVYTSITQPHLEFLDEVSKKLGFPMVVKKVYGSLGEGVFLVQDKEELINLYREICHNPILFQKYMATSKGHSIRVIIIDGKVFGGFIRKNGGDFRSNFGTTAGSEKLQNPEKYFSFAQKIAEKLDIEYAGIDLLDDKNGEIVLCEINSNAFFEEFEKTTGLNVAKAFAEMVARKIYE